VGGVLVELGVYVCEFAEYVVGAMFSGKLGVLFAGIA
jgi:hypothetical protein